MSGSVETEYFGRAGKIVAAAEARGAAEERARLRERVKERRETLDMRPPLTKDGYLLALDDVMAMLAEPGQGGA